MSITIANNAETTGKAIISNIIIIESSCPQTAEQKDVEYNPNEETQPESGEVSPDEEAPQYEQTEEEYDEEAIEKNLLLHLKRLNILRNEINMQYEQCKKQGKKELTAALENVKYIEKCDRIAILEKINAILENIAFMSESEVYKQVDEAFEILAIEGSKKKKIKDEKVPKFESYYEKKKRKKKVPKNEFELKEAFENILELCEQYPNLNSKIISLEEYINIVARILEKSNVQDLVVKDFDKTPKLEIVYVSDRIANVWRPYILSSSFFLISIIFPLLCYTMYIILLNTQEIFNINPYIKEIFNINPYTKEMFYAASHVLTIASCLFQLSTFSWQILKRTIFVSEVGSNFLYLAMMIIARSLFLYDQNDLNTIDYISVFLQFVALFLLICGTSCFYAWHVDKKRKLIILIGVNIIVLYQYINSWKSVSHGDKFISKECMINVTIICARLQVMNSFLRQLWYLIRRWNSKGAIAVITNSEIVWVNDKDIDTMSSYENGFSGTLMNNCDLCSFFIPKFVVPH